MLNNYDPNRDSKLASLIWPEKKKDEKPENWYTLAIRDENEAKAQGEPVQVADASGHTANFVSRSKPSSGSTASVTNHRTLVKQGKLTGPEWYDRLELIPGNPLFDEYDNTSGKEDDPNFRNRYTNSPNQPQEVKMPPGTSIDWKFMNGVEGHTLHGYVPVNNETNDYFVDSGVTLATGVDLGGKDEKYLRKIGLTPDHSLYWKLKPHMGRKGADASYSLAENPLRVTEGEAQWLNEAVKADFVGQLNDRFQNAERGSAVRSFTDLPPEAQTAVFSFAWHKGMAGFDKSTGFKDAVVSRNWNEAYNELKKMADDPRQSKFKSRREKEADLLYNGIMGGLDEL